VCDLTLVCCCRVQGEDVRLMLWDTAGQEEFDAITKAYYRGTHTSHTPSYNVTPFVWLNTKAFFTALLLLCSTIAFKIPNSSISMPPPHLHHFDLVHMSVLPSNSTSKNARALTLSMTTCCHVNPCTKVF